MLRNPVDVMYSQHSQLVFNQREDLTDFAQALAAEDDRLAGHRLPADAIRPEALYYRRSVRFAEQIERYWDVLGRDRVHFIVFDDLVADPRAVYRSTLEFVGVDPTFEVDLSVYNPNKKPRSGAMQRVIFAPRGPMKRVFGRLRSVPVMHRVRDAMVSANSTKAERKSMDVELRRQLTDEFAPQVAELGRADRARPVRLEPGLMAGPMPRQIGIREAGVAIHDVTFDEAVDLILAWAKEGSGGYVCTPNVDHLVRAKRDKEFRDLMRGARLRLPDGMGLIYGTRLAGTPFRGRVTGRLLPEALVRKAGADTPPIALVGGRDDAPQKAAARLEGLGANVVAAVSPPMGFEIGGTTDEATVAQLVAARPRILIVGMGAPKQEEWMARHQADLPETVMLGLGQTIDILGDRVPAAPHWMTRIGLEWAFRMLRDPRRIGRRVFVDDPPFFTWMVRERMRRRRAD